MSDFKILKTESGQQVVDYGYAKGIIDQQQDIIDKLESALSGSEHERLKLAVHVERLREAAGKIHHWHDAFDDGMVVSAESVRGLWEALEATPQATLAERDAALISQAMIAAAVKFGKKNTTATEVMMYAKEYAERVKRGE